MREILFRGKTEKGEWVQGFYVYCVVSPLPKQQFHRITTGKEKGYGATESYDVIPETIGQYTGLRDKNGIKIYDGDILHFKTYQGGGFACPIGTDVYYRVLFGHCNPDMNILTEYVGFWALGKDYDEDDLYEYGNSISYLVDSHGACVVGNIHDNPELVKECEGE